MIYSNSILNLSVACTPVPPGQGRRPANALELSGMSNKTKVKAPESLVAYYPEQLRQIAEPDKLLIPAMVHEGLNSD